MLLKFIGKFTGPKALGYSPVGASTVSLPVWPEPSREDDSFHLSVELLKSAQLVHPDRGLGGKLKRMKYCLRGLAFARCTAEWFRFLRRHGLESLAERQPHLFHKLQRPYLNRTFNTRQRLDALQQHYRFVTANFPLPVLAEIHQQAGVLLADIPLEGSAGLGLYLSSSCWGQKEGDLMLTLKEQGTAKVLFSLSFSVLNLMEIFIGGLQGRKTVDKSVVVSVTRDLYGMRPKALLLFAVQQLAEFWEINRLRAVSDDLQVYKHVQKRREILACYDEFWTETGGVLAPDGIFDLPSRFLPRELAAIKANKRKMYQRRYEMLAGIADKIRSRMASLKTAMSWCRESGKASGALTPSPEFSWGSGAPHALEQADLGVPQTPEGQEGPASPAAEGVTPLSPVEMLISTALR